MLRHRYRRLVDDLTRVFVGGTGRSGTTATATALGAHPLLTTIPREVRFLASAGGLADVVAGRADPGTFARTLRGAWFRTPREGRTDGGLHHLIDEKVLVAAVRRYRIGPRAALPSARRLIVDLLDPLAGSKGGWIEHTPETVLVARAVAAILPGAHLIHSVRDGRDVGASVATREWGPAHPVEGVRWWCWRLLRASRQSAGWAPGRLHLMRFEDLAIRRRHETLSRLLGDIGVGDHPDVHRHLDEELTMLRASAGRWNALPEAAAVDKAYAAALTRLGEDEAAAGIVRLLDPSDAPVRRAMTQAQRRYEVEAEQRWSARIERRATSR